MKTIFITGGTGYMGRRLIRELLRRGHRVIALVRPGSEQKVPVGAEIVVADPFDAASFADLIPAGSVFVQLLGVAHPSPAKAEAFKQIDLVSVRESILAAQTAQVAHFVYVSVAQEPTRIMQAYQQVRQIGETMARQRGLNCTFIRPWYVVGPGHWWPVLLLPLYGLAELFPGVRQKARALGFVTLSQMLATLQIAIESEPKPLAVFDVADIRRCQPEGIHRLNC
ncbi:SDR family oxidoreductase [Spirosoma sp. KNUC1025]|uniref:SDR family oxidoreductase n=1 Tax=Spirosoma sp. KNUC1025 TaxID=2894082 RepID=UPI003867B5E5|nr:NAD(P)H-binding protein [Spirosoma sp. KNUC1025]